MLARHLHTPIGEIEDMEIDRFTAYSAALNNILRAEAGKPGGAKGNGQATVAQKAAEAFDDVVAKRR